MQDIRSADDFDMGIFIGITAHSMDAFMRQFQTVYDKPTIIVCTDASAPGAQIYVAGGQAIGVLAGGREGAEYESLVGEPGQGLSSISQYTAFTLLFIVLIVAANIASPKARLMDEKDKTREVV
jgi:hypothetical protein